MIIGRGNTMSGAVRIFYRQMSKNRKMYRPEKEWLLKIIFTKKGKISK